MSVDVVDLRAFYASPLGRFAARAIAGTISAIGIAAREGPVIGLGYCPPLFDCDGDLASNGILLMPARQGAHHWPEGAPARVALVDEDELPLANASVPVMVMLHLLENTADPLLALNEAWRVLVPEGRLLVVATNRRGFWARSEHTPFGAGRPFSRSQLESLLREAKLTPLEWHEALSFPPVRNPRLLRLTQLADPLGARLWPVFGGVHIVEASKRLYQGVPAGARKAGRVLVPAFSAQGAARQGEADGAG